MRNTFPTLNIAVADTQGRLIGLTVSNMLDSLRDAIIMTVIVILLFIGLSAHFALYLYTRALTVTKASIVAPLSYLSVIFAGIIGWVVWDQKPSATSLAGMAIVILAGVITTALSSRAPHATR